MDYLDFIGAKGDGGGGDNWSYNTCSSQIITTNTQFFYRPGIREGNQPNLVQCCTKMALLRFDS